MPWKATSVIDQRTRFVLAYRKQVLSGEITMSALCAEHGVSRKTGYKLVARHRESGWPGLQDRSRAPHSGKHWEEAEIISTVLDVRTIFPTWGAGKIIAY